MMVKPSLDDLLKKVDSPYTLAIAAARRARMLNEGAEPLLEYEGKKPVSHALEEIYAGKITIKRSNREGIK
ncbi:DNA-directed RNA polymerase subunit omega [Anoxybacter fermentans]|uniref:DNA-directed RNA polymerase subunit omega n=1 Tax=Anoxybacter fermentans TaxID=1323375 RepID=A0A3S9SXN1_9FIRM|nr:DNA-directed RNA polymerase subunit omega [Anoxybacter fermentans]AZR72974.1 DNA-directed RNA polymerase subunit omega [Anoxybacter fermentans]